MGFLIKLIKYISHVFIWGTWERQTPCLSHQPEFKKGKLATSYSQKGKKEMPKAKSRSKGKHSSSDHTHFLSLLHTCGSLGKFELEIEIKAKRLVGVRLSQMLTLPKNSKKAYHRRDAKSATRIPSILLARVMKSHTF